MKELNQTVLQKQLFSSKKGHLSLAKALLDNPERGAEVESL